MEVDDGNQETHLVKIDSVRPGRPRREGPTVRLSAKPRVEFQLTLTVVEAAQRRMPDAAQDLERRLLEAPISDSPA